MATGKTAVVTGAGTGIGKAVAATLLKNGWNTVFCGRRQATLDEAVAAAGSTDAKALAISCDVTKSAEVEAMFDKAVDAFGRVATDLRVSVTDRCNLRCSYCMPAEGLDWLPKPQLLTFEELARVIGVAVGLGVRSVRLTGGEPLLRRGLPDLVRQVAALRPRPSIAMTTNGLGLDRLAAPVAAGRRLAHHRRRRRP